LPVSNFFSSQARNHSSAFNHSPPPNFGRSGPSLFPDGGIDSHAIGSGENVPSFPSFRGARTCSCWFPHGRFILPAPLGEDPSLGKRCDSPLPSSDVTARPVSQPPPSVCSAKPPPLLPFVDRIKGRFYHIGRMSFFFPGGTREKWFLCSLPPPGAKCPPPFDLRRLFLESKGDGISLAVAFSF